MPSQWIDFHAHFFPDEIAPATVARLAAESNLVVHGDGTLAALEAHAARDGVWRSVNLPVATRPEQVVGINRRVIAHNARPTSVVSFGAMHPRFVGPERELERLAAAGVRGIKLHPEYQRFFPDEPGLAPLYELCARLGLTIVFHAGRDPGFPTVHGEPRRFEQVLAVAGLNVVLAHMGGWRQWREAERHLIGTRAWLDTAYCAELEDSALRAMIQGHGSERILFGTDFPWVRAAPTIAQLEALALPASELANISHRNAERLLAPVAP